MSLRKECVANARVTHVSSIRTRSTGFTASTGLADGASRRSLIDNSSALLRSESCSVDILSAFCNSSSSGSLLGPTAELPIGCEVSSPVRSMR